jgi:hypothetical protein
MAFFCRPERPVLLYLAVTKPVLPGITASLVQAGVVQPQVTSTRSMITGCVPVLVNVKVCSTTSPCAISPKLCSVASNVMAGPVLACACGAEVCFAGPCWATAPPATSAAIAKERKIFFMGIKSYAIAVTTYLLLGFNEGPIVNISVNQEMLVKVQQV